MIQFFLVFVGFWQAFRSSLKDARFQALLVNVVFLLTVGTVFYWRVEKWTLFESLYFSVITLCTVGYGDFAPQTTLGRGFTIVYVLIGIGLIVTFVSYFADQAVSRREAKIVQRRAAHTNADGEQQS
jgi:voltage-gated potassium channel